MYQAKASPVPAHVPMFRVPTGLRRVPAAVPPTAVAHGRTPLPFANRLELCLRKLHGRTQWVGTRHECGREVCTRISQRLTNGRGVRPCATAVCGTAAGTRRSTVGTLNMGTWDGTGEALAWDIASDVPSTSPSHGSNSGAQGGSYSTHTYCTVRF